MSKIIEERLAVIENNQDSQKETLQKQTDVLESINSHLGMLNSRVEVNSAIIKTIQTNVTDNRLRASFLPNVILTAVITVSITLWIGQSKSQANETTPPQVEETVTVEKTN